MIWEVPAEWAGERADKVLAHLSGFSRAVARASLDDGEVTIDGHRVEPTFKVTPGDRFEGAMSDGRAPLVAEPVDFGVTYEDRDIVVIDKPAGVVTHPGAGNRSGTLAGGVLHRWPQVRGVGMEDRWGIVHRLDRDTSGLIVVALTGPAFDALTEAMRDRRVRREYLAAVMAVPSAATGTVDAPLGRDRRRPTRMRVDPDGRRAVTHFRVERALPGGALLRVSLETGRTHQIRVHLASIGLPIAGDHTYGTSAGSPRMFLHATRLSLDHPTTAEPLDLVSPLPEDLSHALSVWEAHG